MTARWLDQNARDRITSDTGSTLFVNAGAGSGKTHALVNRVLHLVLTDNVPLRHIAAVTFTEKAGAELRDRLRVRFEAQRAEGSECHRERADEALNDLDSAAIGTLHAFAQRLLMEHPIEARLAPQLEVLDEIGSSVAFEDRWSELRTELLDDDSMEEPLLLGMAVGITLDHLRSLAVLLGNDWDLIHDQVLFRHAEQITPPPTADLLARGRRLADLGAECTEPEDRLLEHFRQLRVRLGRLACAPDVEAELSVLEEIGKIAFSNGQKGNWSRPIDEVRAAGRSFAADATKAVDAVRHQCLRRLTHWLAAQVVVAAEGRRAQSRLEFHDLLVLARELLRTSASTRRDLHDRYQRLLLDEFQDTDPIQIELAVRIAGGEEAAANDWRDVVVPAGRLFVVGDPKQSIYRFRRASIATYLDAQKHLGETVSLTTNFRTVAPILDWVNAVFAQLIQAEPDGQPSYEPLNLAREDVGRGPGVMLLGAEPHRDLPRASAAILRTREAADVAGAVTQAMTESWQVFDRVTQSWRRCRLDDIAVLVPARTSLPFLEEALDAAGIEHRTEASSLVYQADEVRSLLACVRAVADPTDSLALVQALRSPLFGCGDDDLWRWKYAGGAFNIYARLENAALNVGPVGSALTYLRQLAFDSRWRTPSEVLGAVVADRRMLELAATGPRARDAWRRLRFVVDQARAWAESSDGGLRNYLAWAAHQGQETSRVAESVLPETDADAVRVMTIHAAKGLEFPIVILSGLTAQSNRRRGVQVLWPASGGYAVKLSSSVQTEDFDAAQPIDEQMDDLEKRRLLYVAATRARDHLVVSLHRPDKAVATAARLLAGAGGLSAAGAVSYQTPTSGAANARVAPPPVLPPPDYAPWLAELTQARERSRRTSAISASGLEGTEPEVVLNREAKPPGLAKGARDLGLPPWSKGRYGSAVGRAVHAVLQVVPLPAADTSQAAAVADAVAAQCVAEGVVGYEGMVSALVESALRSDLVQRAAGHQHWREQYVGTVTTDGTVLEGYVDLIFRDDDGSFVIVDYKTDAVPAGGLASRVTYYRPQMEAYAECLRAATGGEVRAELLFLHPGGGAVPVPAVLP
ncbi:ATP-dependent exoDNAse (exonuclease V) beta subunit (contains helicase and exonuclease domains) [Friedmanniella luteola]|uniref:DNA 3'-5' helicase n=1 Tax=Friedmanniella luteola TaxID=546871 RepID=A0A1H1ZLC7_9ACTN|nr:UvrD-helicase domain-containing protein [Friedmanniella luteola]SDT34621.1 ATP-dependent exoDNAse (exonuclease V) beta subunit (contains helicase and exonuclease domains) [Friedmanniella luteola]